MPSDASAFSAIMSWTMGVVALLSGGIATPVMLGFLPDAVVYRMRSDDSRPAMAILGSSTAMLALAVYFLTLTGRSGSPSPLLWSLLIVATFLATASGAAMYAVVRAVGRRRAHSAAVKQMMAPRATRIEATGHPAPPESQTELSWRAAEYLAADWMRHLGVSELEVTPETADEGVDVRSMDYIAQVKKWSRDQIGVVLVRELHGVAAKEGRTALFFSTTNYTSEATAFAREVGMALFIMRPAEGRLVPVGPLAQKFRDHGLPVSASR